MVGVDPARASRSSTPARPIRHLGVLLSVGGATAFADQLYEQRLRSIDYRAKQWSKHDLTLLGRCEVARQVLASCLVYHAQFVPVPERLMSLIQRRIKAFTLGLGCIRAADHRQLCADQQPQVASLPAKQGGIGHVDVRAHATAMQAKVAVACCTLTGTHGSSSCGPTWSGSPGWGSGCWCSSASTGSISPRGGSAHGTQHT